MMGRKLFSTNRKYQCSLCFQIRRTFPAISHHLVIVHNGAGVAIKLMP